MKPHFRVQLLGASTIIERARFKGEHFVVHNFGKPTVIILGIDEYNALVKSAANAASSANPEPVNQASLAPIDRVPSA